MDQALQKYTRAQFSQFFRAKYWRLIQAVFNSHEKRPDYSSPDVIEGVVQHYRELAAQPMPLDMPATPRHIWILWQQGWENAPPIVQRCAQSWKDMNPGWEVHLISEEQVCEFAPDYKNINAPNISAAARSDIARLFLLQAHGGVWTDATVFCQIPLDDWLPKVMGAGFFMFSKPRPYRVSDVWFLASADQTELLNQWVNIITNYWDIFSRPHHYYWLPYLFEFLMEEEASVAQAWNAVPNISAIGPLITQGIPFEQSVPDNTLKMIDQKIIPVHKLSHKWRFKGVLTDTSVGRLTGLEKL